MDPPLKEGRQASLTGNPSPLVVILQITLEFVLLFQLGLGNFLFLCRWQKGWELVGKGRSQAVINIKPLLRPIQDVGREIDVKEWRFVGHLDPKADGVGIY